MRVLGDHLEASSIFNFIGTSAGLIIQKVPSLRIEIQNSTYDLESKVCDEYYCLDLDIYLDAKKGEK